jgi:hypothetical protein
MELYALAEKTRKLKPIKLSPREMARRICILATKGEQGWSIVERPRYGLKSASRPDRLHLFITQNLAYKVLMVRRQFMDAEELTAGANALGLRVGGKSFSFDPFYTDEALTDTRFADTFSKRGRLRIAHKATAESRRAVEDERTGRGTFRKEQNIHEAYLEQFIAEDLDRIEPGLRLVGRQYQALPVGRIDLLCTDRSGGLVVIELKKLRASTSSIIDQITRYLGWVREHMAKPRQSVRGILITGRPDDRLRYSLKALPDVTLVTLDISLSVHSAD